MPDQLESATDQPESDKTAESEEIQCVSSHIAVWWLRVDWDGGSVWFL